LGNNKAPDEFEDFTKFCEFVGCELGDIPVLDRGAFVSRKIRYYWLAWRKYEQSRTAQQDALYAAKQFYALYGQAQYSRS
jgi:hypothetical protein